MWHMKKLKMDGRKSRQGLYEMRKQVVSLYKKGIKLKETSEITGLCWEAVRNAIDLYGKGGAKALKPNTAGRPKGSSRTLSPDQEAQVQKAICDKRPEQLKMDFALWTREAVLVHFREHFGIDMPVRTVGEYLKRWGFTPQKPIKVEAGSGEEMARRGISGDFSPCKGGKRRNTLGGRDGGGELGCARALVFSAWNHTNHTLRMGCAPAFFHDFIG